MLEDTDDDDTGELLPPVQNQHLALYKACNLPPSRLTQHLFYVVAGLCDPQTQPEETDEFVLSVDCVADLAMALCYKVLLVDTRKRGEGRDGAGQDGEAKGQDDKGQDDKDKDDKGKDDKGKDDKAHIEKTEADAADGKKSDEVLVQNPAHRQEVEHVQKTPNLDLDDPMVASLRFALSLQLFSILCAAQKVLRADDELRVRYLHNDKDTSDELSVHWLPQLDDDADVKVLYYMCCVIVMVLYKLFPSSPYCVALNPYTDYLLRLWKTHTSIVALALEIDRELEEEAWLAHGDYFDTPEHVKRALLGSSAIRTVLAWVLNHALPPVHDVIAEDLAGETANPAIREAARGAVADAASSSHLRATTHDLQELPMLDFFHPLSRTARNCGALVAEERLYMVAQLMLGSRLTDNTRKRTPLEFPMFDWADYSFRLNEQRSFLGATGDLVTDTYHGDQFDEDTKYVFGYYDSDEESETAPSDTEDVAMALRAKAGGIAFDEDGRDWRDCVRGDNVEFTEEFLALDAKFNLLPVKLCSNDFFDNWDDIKRALEFIEQLDMENSATFLLKMGQVYANTIAKAIKDEDTETDSDINPDKFYKFFVSPAPAVFLDGTYQRKSYLIQLRPVTNFELILINNPTIACTMLDELFMCPGLRRSLIWYLTHGINLNMHLINYIYELAVGMRGNSPDRQSPFKFSRKGSLLVLLPIERLMLLHEFFLSSSMWLYPAPKNALELPELRATKLVSYICLMTRALISHKVIIFDKSDADYYEDYSHELLMLLFPWIGKAPEARELYFSMRNEAYADGTPDGTTSPDGTPNPDGTPKPDGAANPADSSCGKPANSNFNSSPGKSGSGDRPRNIAEAVQDLEELSDDDIYRYAGTDAALAVFTDFAHRIFYHICKQHQQPIDEEEFVVSTNANDDFGFFLLHYNQLARCNHFVLLLFDLLRPVLTGKRPGKDEEEEEVHAPADSEFNDEFLNGEGQFQEKSTKKKKTKKKKKKGKKK